MDFHDLTSDAADTVNDSLNQFFSNRIMTSCVIVGCILLATNQEFWMEELTIVARTDLIDWRGI